MPPEEPEHIPLGSWRRLYTAVLVTAFAAMALALAFSIWPY